MSLPKGKPRPEEYRARRSPGRTGRSALPGRLARRKEDPLLGVVRVAADLPRALARLQERPGSPHP